MGPYETHAISVSELNGYAKNVMERDLFLSDVIVRGEISNFVNHRTGHFYFSLKDDSSAIKAVMFRSSAQRLPFIPENGMNVIIHGRVSIFERDGAYQLYADAMQPDGIGSLYYAYEQLKRRLEAEGLFAESRKKPLPRIPERIGIVTSPTGAAIHDMTRIIYRRFPIAETVLYPSLVQGEGAAKNLCDGIEYFNAARCVDVIIIGKGAGSIEDLWAFNDEMLARTVAASKIPIISAVGHESDFTICDLAADVRASTPSAAAELAVPDKNELRSELVLEKKRMTLLVSARIEEARRALEMLALSPSLRSPTASLDTKRLLLASKLDRLDLLIDKKVAHDAKTAYREKAAALGAMDPLAVLSRGYGVTYDEQGKVVKSVKALKPGDKITGELSDGRFFGVITDTEIGKEKMG